MATIHEGLAKGRWYMLTLAEQMGNIGSEVHRALMYQKDKQDRFDGAVNRALELFDLTLEDPRHRGRLHEVARAREVFCGAVFDEHTKEDSLRGLDDYLTQFAVLARQQIKN